VTRSRTEVGLLDRGELVRYRGTATGSEGAVLEALASAMHQFSVAELYFHGGAVTPGLVKAAKSSVSCPVATLNPFRTMRIPGSLRGFESFAGKEHRFAAAAGSALEPG
jgi:hypothetical protein